MDHIKALYEEEIEAYKQQIHELRLRNKSCDDNNTALVNKIRTMEDLIEKANLANKDLNMAFEHVREENLRLQLTHQEPPAITHHELEPEPKAIGAAESLTWITERDRMNQRIKFLERECGRYHRDNLTLGKQVRHLLRSLEEERGMIIRHQSQESESSLVCAADVIDKHLVTFESIEQLQQQNQKLLTLVKNLSAEQEERDITVESEEVKKLNSQIEELSRQLDTIKSDRDRVLNALNTIHKERDLFKILLCKTRQVEHMTPEIFQRMVSVACSSGPAIEDKVEKTAEKDAHIEDLKGMVSKLEDYVSQLRKELDDLRKESHEEIKLKDQLLQKSHSKILDETKRADVLHERNEVLENNIQALTSEFDETRVKCQKMILENEEIKRKNDELSGVIDRLEMSKKQLGASLDSEKRGHQETSNELASSQEQCRQLRDALEREAQIRQKELTAIFQDIQNRQSIEVREQTKKQVELQMRLEELQMQLANADAQSSYCSELQTRLEQAHRDFLEMQSQRNIERQLHMRLSRRLRKRAVQVQPRFKRRPKRVHFAMQPDIRTAVLRDIKPILQPSFKQRLPPVFSSLTTPDAQSKISPLHTNLRTRPTIQIVNQPRIQPEVQSQIQSGVQPEVQSEVPSENQPVIRPENQSDAKPVVQTGVQPEVQLTTLEETQFTTHTKSLPDTQVDLQPSSQSEEQQNVQSEFDMHPDMQATVQDLHPIIQPDIQMEVQPCSQSDIQPIILSNIQPANQLDIQSDIQLRDTLDDRPNNTPDVPTNNTPDGQTINTPDVPANNPPDVQPSTIRLKRRNLG